MTAPDQPSTQRLTSYASRSLGVAASLIVIALAGVVAFVVNRQHSKPKAPSARRRRDCRGSTADCDDDLPAIGHGDGCSADKRRCGP